VKAVICTIREGVHIHTPGVDRWEVCQCGQTGAKWEDPEAGRLIVACRSDRSKVRGLGLNNQLLLRAVTLPGQAWEDYREWHDIATDAPGYVFDKAKAGCWAVVFRVGSTSDTRWATEAEYMECWPHDPERGEAAGELEKAQATAEASVGLVRDILEALCRRDGLPLESTAEPGEPARNYELGDRLGIGRVFGLKEQP